MTATQVGRNFAAVARQISVSGLWRRYAKGKKSGSGRGILGWTAVHDYCQTPSAWRPSGARLIYFGRSCRSGCLLSRGNARLSGFDSGLFGPEDAADRKAGLEQGYCHVANPGKCGSMSTKVKEPTESTNFRELLGNLTETRLRLRFVLLQASVVLRERQESMCFCPFKASRQG